MGDVGQMLQQLPVLLQGWGPFPSVALFASNFVSHFPGSKIKLPDNNNKARQVLLHLCCLSGCPHEDAPSPIVGGMQKGRMWSHPIYQFKRTCTALKAVNAQTRGNSAAKSSAGWQQHWCMLTKRKKKNPKRLWPEYFQGKERLKSGKIGSK